jgi:hypothetical protein
MSPRIARLGPGRVRCLLGAALLLAPALLPAWQEVCRADDCKHCPPPYYHCQEAPPCIKFKHACPRPVCPPCNSDFFGYYPTCWRIWPAGQSNCPVTQPPWVPVPPSFATPGNPFGLHGLTGALVLPPEGPGLEVAPAPRTTPPANPPLVEPVRPRLESNLWQPSAQPRLALKPAVRPTLWLETEPPDGPPPTPPRPW